MEAKLPTVPLREVSFCLECEMLLTGSWVETLAPQPLLPFGKVVEPSREEILPEEVSYCYPFLLKL